MQLEEGQERNRRRSKEWTGMTYEDIARLAQDREQWKITTADLLLEENCTDNDDDAKENSRLLVDDRFCSPHLIYFKLLSNDRVC